MRKQRIDGLMTGENIHLNVDQHSNAWCARMTNTVINAIDYSEISARKLFRKYRNTRPLADIERKYRYEEPDAPLLPRVPMIDRVWTAGNSTRRPDEIIAVGLREMQRQKSAPVCRPQPPNVFLDTPRMPEGQRTDAIPSVGNSRVSTASVAGWSRPMSSARIGGRKARLLTASTTVEEVEVAPSLKPVTQPMSTHMSIPLDRRFVETLGDNEKVMFHIKKFWEPARNPLTNSNEYAKGTKSAAHVMDTTTDWLSFMGADMDPNLYGGIIDAFTGSIPPREYYTIETETGCLIARQLSKDTKANIGINGVPVIGRDQPIALRDVIKENLERASGKGFRSAKENKLLINEPSGPQPLCMEDQLSKPGVKIIQVKPKVESHQKVIETKMGKPAYEREILRGRPKVCDPYLKPTEDKQLMYFTKNTRALKNRFIHIEDDEPDGKRKASRNNAFSYEAIREHVASNPVLPQTNNNHLDESLTPHEEWKDDPEDLDCLTVQDLENAGRFLDTPTACSSQVNLTGRQSAASGRYPLLSTATAQTLLTSLQQRSSVGLDSDFIMCSSATTSAAGGLDSGPPAASPRTAAVRGAHSAPLHRPIHGASLHKTSAAQGASFGGPQQGPREFVSFVTPLAVDLSSNNSSPEGIPPSGNSAGGDERLPQTFTEVGLSAKRSDEEHLRPNTPVEKEPVQIPTALLESNTSFLEAEECSPPTIAMTDEEVVPVVDKVAQVVTVNIPRAEAEEEFNE